MGLLPRNDEYFADFDASITLVHSMTQLLRRAVEEPRLPADLAAQMKALETQADGVTKRCLVRLDASFITPIEREDIHLLAVRIDDIADAIESATNRLNIYDIIEPTPELRSIVVALDEMVECLVPAVSLVRQLKPAIVREATGRVDELEEKVDHIVREALRVLFARKPEAYDLLRWREVYGILESASDAGRLVARTVNHILVRHS